MAAAPVLVTRGAARAQPGAQSSARPSIDSVLDMLDRARSRSVLKRTDPRIRSSVLWRYGRTRGYPYEPLHNADLLCEAFVVGIVAYLHAVFVAVCALVVTVFIAAYVGRWRWTTGV
jgi:hypothetical protein